MKTLRRIILCISHTQNQQGDDWNIDSELVNELEKFTCYNMYGYPRVCSIDDVLAVIVKNMVGDGDTITTSSKVDLSKHHAIAL